MLELDIFLAAFRNDVERIASKFKGSLRALLAVSCSLTWFEDNLDAIVFLVLEDFVAVGSLL